MTEENKKQILDLDSIITEINGMDKAVKLEAGKVLYTIIKLNRDENNKEDKGHVDIRKCKVSGPVYIGKDEDLNHLKGKILKFAYINFAKNKYFKEYEDMVITVSDQDGNFYDINQEDLEFDRVQLMNTVYNTIRTEIYDKEKNEDFGRREVMGK